MAVTSIQDKSTTCDEIVYLPAGYSYWKYNDYRINPENGNLPQRWMAIPLLFGDYKFPSLDQPNWKESKEWDIGREFFYRLDNNLETMLWQGRAMMAVIGAALGLVIYIWSRRLFGPVGGIISLVIYVFDPSMLAHGRLMTCDVPATLFFLLSMGCLWIMLNKVSIFTLGASCLAMGGLFLAKMSGVLILPMGLGLVAIRLIGKQPLKVAFGRTWRIVRRSRKALIFLGAIIVHTAAVIVMIWASYGFRYSIFRPSESSQDKYRTEWSTILSEGGPVLSSISFFRDHKLLPEGYLYGFGHAYWGSKARKAFLRGEYGVYGWLTFFPYCFMVKTPLPIMAVVVLAGVVVLLKYRAARTKESPSIWLSIGKGLYRTSPLWVLMIIYWIVAIFTRLNIGHRHILPTYPPMYVLAGAAGYWLLTRLRWANILIGLLLAVLVLESAIIRPHYLAYFNQSVGGPSKAYRYLVDSSLDWGQDLPGLKKWLERNVDKDENVYLSYFGHGSPVYYRIRARRLAGFTDFDRSARIHITVGLEPGVYCISATMLQTILIKPWGPWTADNERNYHSVRREIIKFSVAQKDKDPDTLKRLIDSKSEGYWPRTMRFFDELQLARLCAYLRKREPDDSVGYSILIYRLSNEDIRRALYDRPPELKPNMKL